MSNDDTSVRVAVRIRPQVASEVIDMCRICTRVTPGEPQVTLGADKSFTYDHVFDMEATQCDIYEACVSPLVDGALAGYNATVLAYGQTGSGKTYTMGTTFEVDPQDEQVGIIPRAIGQLFRGIEHCAEECKENGQLPPEVTVHAQFLELYNEEIIDLLDSSRDSYANRANLRVTEDGAGGVRVTGACTRPVAATRDALSALRSGALARTTASTNMNATSSRSHAVFTLNVTQRRLCREQMEDGGPNPTTEFETLSAKFHFVDLAGSERLKRTGATGDRAREGISINCGLLALGNVISALGDKSRKATHIPYRDSKLTRLLQDSLGGNSRTLMIACVSPSDRDFMETLNTLKYANRARNIKNKVVLNQDKSSRTIALLRQEVTQLQLELLEYRQGKRIISEDGSEGINDLYHENTILQSEVETLRSRIKGMQATIDGLLSKNSELIAEKTLGVWSTPGQPLDPDTCDLTALVRGYVEEIEELRAKLLEAESAREASEKRRPSRVLNHHDSIRYTHDSDAVLNTARKEIVKEKQLLERSMSECLGERERAEGESGGDSEPESDEEHDQTLKDRVAELACLSGDIDTKQRLIEELELSQKRLTNMKKHYEEKLLALQHRIKLTQEERDRVLASLTAGGTRVGGANQNVPMSDEAKRIKDQYERKLADMGRELRRLNQARAEHAKLARSSSDALAKLDLARRQLHDMKRMKVKLLNQMKEESNRHKREQAERAREIAKLRRESARHAHTIRGLEAESRAREGVLKRKREELAAVRRNARVRPGGEASHKRIRALERALEESALRRTTLAEIEADMERQLEERARLSHELRVETESETRDALEAAARFASEAVADAQQQLCAAEAESENDESLREAITMLRPQDALDAIKVLTTITLRHASQYALAEAKRNRAERKLREMESEKATLMEVENKLQISPAQSQYNGNTNNIDSNILNGNLLNGSPPSTHIMSKSMTTNGSNVTRFATDAALAKFAHISSGTSTRSVSPVDSALLELRNDAKKLTLDINSDKSYTFDRTRLNDLSNSPNDRTFDKSPGDNTAESRFARYTTSRGSVRLRDLGVLPREDALSRSLHEGSQGNYPLTRVPSAPGDLKHLSSPRSPRRSLQSPLLTRSNVVASPPMSPQLARRTNNDADVFCRLTAAVNNDVERPAGGTVKEYDGKAHTRSGLQCTHIAVGHIGAVLSLAAQDNNLYSGGVDRCVRVWDMSVGRECRCLCGHSGGVVAIKHCGQILASVAGQHIRVWDLRTGQPIKTLWSSGAVGGPGPARGGSLGEVTINDACLSPDGYTLYSACSDKLRVWDLRKYETLGRLSTGHQAAVMCLAVTKSANSDDVIVTGSKDHYVRLMEGKLNRRILQPPHYDGVQSVCIVGNHVYSGSRDASIKRWNVAETHEAPHSVTAAHKGWVTSLSWWEETNTLVSTCRGGLVRLWDRRLSPVARAQNEDALHAHALTKTHLYTAGGNGEVKAWRRTTSTTTDTQT